MEVSGLFLGFGFPPIVVSLFRSFLLGVVALAVTFLIDVLAVMDVPAEYKILVVAATAFLRTFEGVGDQAIKPHANN